MNMENKEKPNVYQEVTRRIVMSLTQGDIPWRKPWNTPIQKGAFSYTTGKAYRGINRFLLNKPGEYLTFNQAKKLKGNIKKGEKGQYIVKYGIFIPAKDKKEAERLESLGQSTEHLKQIYIKYGYVFHIDQTEGIKSKVVQTEMKPSENPVDLANSIIRQYHQNTFVTIMETEQDFCAFDKEQNTILTPERKQFQYEEDWYYQVFREIAHSLLPQKEDKKKDEAKDELIIEMAASMLMNTAELENKETEKNTTAKCQEWIRILNNDYRIAISAAAQAEKIVRSITEPLFGTDEPEDETDESSEEPADL